jgi:hypothetical protein
VLKAPLPGGMGFQGVLAVEDPLVVGRGRNPGTINLLIPILEAGALHATPPLQPVLTNRIMIDIH